MSRNDRTATELDGRTWTRYSISVWNDIQKSSAERHLKHPALFPRQLVRRLLAIFSMPGDLVLDPFMGSGSTLLEAGSMKRRGLGLDISREYLELFRSRQGKNREGEKFVSVFHDDARNLAGYAADSSVDLCLTSPPYWNILKQKRSADKKDLRHYGEDQLDLGNIAGYEMFLDELQEIFSAVYQALKPGKYCIVVVMDIRKKNRFYPLHIDLSSRLQLVGFTLDDIIIWDRRKEYNNLRPLGFPYVFRVNKVHEYLLIFQKQWE